MPRKAASTPPGCISPRCSCKEPTLNSSSCELFSFYFIFLLWWGHHFEKKQKKMGGLKPDHGTVWLLYFQWRWVHNARNYPATGFGWQINKETNAGLSEMHLTKQYNTIRFQLFSVARHSCHVAHLICAQLSQMKTLKMASFQPCGEISNKRLRGPSQSANL